MDIEQQREAQRETGGRTAAESYVYKQKERDRGSGAVGIVRDREKDAQRQTERHTERDRERKRHRDTQRELKRDSQPARWC